MNQPPHASDISPALSADALVHAAPLIRKYQGKTIVLKYGGNAMTEPALQQALAQDVVLLHMLGMRPVVVHGGGPQIESALKRVGLQGQFIQGMRVTDAETMGVVQWVLAGEVQQELVGLIHQAGGKAVGLTGRDGAMIRASKLQLFVKDQGDTSKPVDIGQVGDIVSVDAQPLHTLLDAGYIPVVSPIGLGDAGESYNINADVVAASVSVALQAEKLLMLTNIAGVLDQSGELLTELTPARIEALCADGTISGGMIPKIAGALDAAKRGVKAVHILDGRVPHGMLQELLFGQPCGTMIRS